MALCQPPSPNYLKPPQWMCFLSTACFDIYQVRVVVGYKWVGILGFLPRRRFQVRKWADSNRAGHLVRWLRPGRETSWTISTMDQEIYIFKVMVASMTRSRLWKNFIEKTKKVEISSFGLSRWALERGSAICVVLIELSICLCVLFIIIISCHPPTIDRFVLMASLSVTIRSPRCFNDPIWISLSLHHLLQFTWRA